MVLSGTVEREGNAYHLTLTASEAVTGNVIRSVEDRASSKEQVLGAVAKVAAEMRKALGDESSESSQRFAMDTLSATSLDVVHEYATAMQALADSDFNEALAGFSRAVDLDPNFGLAYAGMAITSRNLDRQQDAQTYVEKALSHLDGMTERERYRTRGLYYMVTGDHRACVKEYGDLIARYSADAAARNNLALCSTYLRDLPKALTEMQQVVKILPNRALYRENLALYAAYAGDFPAAEREVRRMKDPSVFGLLALAFSQVGRDQVAEAAETYRQIEKIDALGASYAASGLGDLALYQGRISDASRIFQQGAASDQASGDLYRSAVKLIALGHAQLLRDQNGAAVASAIRALANSKAIKVRFLAARLLVEAGESDQAQAIAKELSLEFQEEPRAYAKIIQGIALLKDGNPREAVQVLSDANGLLDTWIGHFDLGRAYLEGGAFPQADSEFDRCLARRGEALSFFLDEEPTYGYFPLVYFYQGRVREGLHSSRAVESYQAYANIRGRADEDPLLPDVLRRIGN